MVNDLTKRSRSTGARTERHCPVNVLVLLGSLREGSSSRRLTEAATAELGEDVTVEVSELPRLLPHYDQDLDRSETLPEPVAAFRAQVAAADALLVVTPEYNGSLPGVLKNAIDWASRPRGASSLDGLRTAVLSVSPSPRGAQWAREDAVKVLTVAGASVEDRAAGLGSSGAVLGEHLDLPALEAVRSVVRSLTAVPVAA